MSQIILLIEITKIEDPTANNRNNRPIDNTAILDVIPSKSKITESTTIMIGVKIPKPIEGSNFLEIELFVFFKTSS